jgi:hypothetical protein
LAGVCPPIVHHTSVGTSPESAGLFVSVCVLAVALVFEGALVLESELELEFELPQPARAVVRSATALIVSHFFFVLFIYISSL